MKKNLISLLSLILAIVMIGSVMAACDKPDNGTETNKIDETEGTTSQEETGSVDTEETDAKTDASETDSLTETETETEPVVGPELTGDFADTIEYANAIANGVQSYYLEAERENYRVINKNMTLDYSLSSYTDQQVSSIKNTKGKSYIENTMDVFVTMKNGKTYFASASTASTRPNIYRLGYYYYDVHLLEQNFLGSVEVLAEKEFNARIFSNGHDITNPKNNDDVLSYTVTGKDPYIYSTSSKSNDRFYFLADEFNALKFSLKATSSKSGELYVIAGSHSGHSREQMVSFTINPDGEWHTYTVDLSKVEDFTDRVTGFRFDIGSMGEQLELKDVKAVKLADGTPNLVVDRTLHTYPDKMNQVLHFVARDTTTNIEALGMTTDISADTVDKIVVKDANGLHDTLDGVDWDSAEYVGFDIKGVGIFGYILLQHEDSGKLEVVLENGVYTITQISCPKDGTIIPPDAKNTYTDNDFFMGHRIYTDEYHTFDRFLVEADYERNPLKSITGDNYVGYDALRGAYKYIISGTGFNEPFFNSWNRHYSTEVTVKGGKEDRNIYVYTLYSGGTGEGAAILDNNDMLLPIPVMIYKNFGGENEEPVFFAGDHTYSETFFPLVIPAGEKISLQVLNPYMNWGAFPLKQLSSIQYFWPYYHLSLGTTETSCISPWFGARDLWTLPDFRAISMPYWFELEGDAYSNQPQHTHGGYQYFLQYTDADGNHYATENINNDIVSSGLSYAEVKMDYISDDGKIKVSYNHLEFAQTDELRAMYEIEYEILEEVKIADFKKDFSFYSFEGYSGKYQKMGYIDENNQVVHKNTNLTDEPEYIKLGDKCPYVSLYDLKTDTENSWTYNNVNLGFVIHNSEFVFGGEKFEGNFIISGAAAKYSLSLDMGEVTLKPGDTMKINMVIVPWGWYNSTDDTNMQLVRENTCLDYLVCQITDGEAIESPFIPKIRTTNGKSAEFILSGASNNVAVRVYGFNKLTAPKIYEKINGEWQEYVVCSIDNPDKLNNKHYYDGYNVYYDGDGTYSYSFTINMDDVDSRTFKIVAEEDFKAWPEIPVEENNDPINVYQDPEELSGMASANSGLGTVAVSDDKSYVRFYGNGEKEEAFFTAYASTNEDIVTGQYLIIKYRIPTTNSESGQFQIFTSTENAGTHPSDNFYLAGLTKDNDWHIIIADLSKQGLPTFTASENGKYTAKYLRLDIFNSKMSTQSYIDLAYLGISDNLEDICALNANEGTAIISECGQNVGTIDFATGKITEKPSGGSSNDSSSTTTTIPENLVDPESGFTKSETPYISGIDFINGKGDEVEGDPQYNNKGGNYVKGPELFNYDGPTAGESILAFAGWTMVYKGIDKYMWSADEGKTWHECIIYGRETIGDASAPVINIAQNNFKNTDPDYDASQYAYKAGYQGAAGKPSGVAAKLDAYVGKEVNVIYAVVPENDPDGLCLIAYVTNVRVYASDAEAADGEKCKHTSASVYNFIDDGDASTDLAKMQSTCACGEVKFDVVDPNYVFFFGSLGTQSNVAPLVMENKYGYRMLSATTLNVSGTDKPFTADADGILKITGWAGVNGGIGDVVFKVTSTSGNELTDGWATAAPTLQTNQKDLDPEMAKRNIETVYGVRYSLSIDLAPYFATNEEVTVALALVVSDVPEGSNDKYVPLGEFSRVSKAS